MKRRAFLAGLGCGAALAAPRPAGAAYGFNPSIAPTPYPGFGGASTRGVTIGVAGPFSGDADLVGVQLQRGVEAACADANLYHGPLDRTFVVRTFDDQNLVSQAITSAQYACDDASVLCMIGHLGGRVTAAALRTYVNARMPLIVPASTFDALTATFSGNVVRLPTRDGIEGLLGARDWLAKRPGTTIVVLMQNGDYGPDVARGFAREASAHGGHVVEVAYPTAEADLAAVAARVLAPRPDLVFLAGLVREMGPLVPILRGRGYAGALRAPQGFFDPLSLGTYAEALDGIMVSSSMPPIEYIPDDIRIVQDYGRRYGLFTPLVAFGYAAAQIAIAAIKQSVATTRLALARALELPTPYRTVVGTFTFQPTGDPTDPNLYFYEIAKGAWRYSHAAHPAPFLTR